MFMLTVSVKFNRSKFALILAVKINYCMKQNFCGTFAVKKTVTEINEFWAILE